VAATVVKAYVLFGYDHHLLLLFLFLLLANKYSALRLISYIHLLLLLLLLHVLNLPSKKSFLELGYRQIPQVRDCQYQVWVRAHKRSRVK
jgi:hypothetical protein